MTLLGALDVGGGGGGGEKGDPPWCFGYSRERGRGRNTNFYNRPVANYC